MDQRRQAEYQKIIKKSGIKPNVCKCKSCQSQCQRVCLGTPADILRLIQNGYGMNILPTAWAVSMVWGIDKEPIQMYQLANFENGCCMLKDGLCQLHESGLKPIEGKLSSHMVQVCHPTKTLSYLIARTWLDPQNEDIIKEITNYYEK